MIPFLKDKIIKKIFFTLLAVIFVTVTTIAYLAIQSLESGEPYLLTASKKISKSLIMRGLDQIESTLSSTIYAPTPFDSSSFSYADLSHLYFEKIRNDNRVNHFYITSKPIDFNDALAISEYLRDLFPHGSPPTSYLNTNVLEMIDAAEKGETFLCEDIAKMLVQLIQAGGTQARTIGLYSQASDHVVVELWSRWLNKWVVIDPDNNVHYTNAIGIPLSTLDLYVISQNNDKIKEIKRVTGRSVNTLHHKDRKLIEKFYKSGYSIHFYNKWVDKNLPRKHPARSAAIMGAYIGKSTVEKFYHKNSVVLNDKVIAKLYKKP
jgi:hypothetical protein